MATRIEHAQPHAPSFDHLALKSDLVAPPPGLARFASARPSASGDPVLCLSPPSSLLSPTPSVASVLQCSPVFVRPQVRVSKLGKERRKTTTTRVRGSPAQTLAKKPAHTVIFSESPPQIQLFSWGIASRHLTPPPFLFQPQQRTAPRDRICSRHADPQTGPSLASFHICQISSLTRPPSIPSSHRPPQHAVHRIPHTPCPPVPSSARPCHPARSHICFPAT
ncbi:hypothetical protein BOTBODRAFT_31245 [Botryobasidium botryosum FD-172 SS1]|uniref:Uncharacterized protein n=1 Tax=Botryobasidium botryosum (strain FD-172 SS1) TaxID=930990 RepID=A0A067MWA3_BOTB1|nr:hypothetical protein BOTBODRAFT_31245 [Botryobasidium botryosum FD-172 SS1]